MDQATYGLKFWPPVPPYPIPLHHKPRSQPTPKSNYTTIYTILISIAIAMANEDLIQGAIAAVNNG